MLLLIEQPSSSVCVCVYVCLHPTLNNLSSSNISPYYTDCQNRKHKKIHLQYAMNTTSDTNTLHSHSISHSLLSTLKTCILFLHTPTEKEEDSEVYQNTTENNSLVVDEEDVFHSCSKNNVLIQVGSASRLLLCFLS